MSMNTEMEHVAVISQREPDFFVALMKTHKYAREIASDVIMVNLDGMLTVVRHMDTEESVARFAINLKNSKATLSVVK